MDLFIDILQIIFGTDRTALVFFLSAIVIIWSMYRENRSDSSPYEFSDLYTTGDRMDVDKTMKLLSVLVTTFIVVHMEMREYTTEWMIVAYLGLTGGLAFASVWARIKGNAPKEEPKP